MVLSEEEIKKRRREMLNRPDPYHDYKVEVRPDGTVVCKEKGHVIYHDPSTGEKYTREEGKLCK